MNLQSLVKFHTPFTYFICDDFFASSEYEKLRTSFPSVNQFRLITGRSGNKKGSSKDGKWVLDTTNPEKWEQFVSASSSKSWVEFINQITSDEFLEELKQVFYPEIKLSHPTIADKRWRFTKDTNDNNVGSEIQEMEPYLQFSKMENGSFIEPHKDSINKIFTLIFYFPSEEWLSSNSSGGGTNIHKVNYPEASIDRRNIYFEFSRFTKLVDSVDFKPNRLMGFIKNNKSYHSIGPINCETEQFRDAFILNVSAKNYNEKSMYKEIMYRILSVVGNFMRKLN